MMKGLIPLLFTGFMASCSVYLPPPKPEKLIMMGVSDDRIVIIKDTNSDGEFDRKFYYGFVGTTEGKAEFEDSNNYFIFEYIGSEIYPSTLDLPNFPRFQFFDLERSVAFKRN